MTSTTHTRIMLKGEPQIRSGNGHGVIVLGLNTTIEASANQIHELRGLARAANALADQLAESL